jgi:alpha-galactosidase
MEQILEKGLQSDRRCATKMTTIGNGQTKMKRFLFGSRTLVGPAFYLAALFLVTSSFADDLTGNWVARSPQDDGTSLDTYLDLKQVGAHITGHIRVTQFYYNIVESTGGPDTFILTGSMMDGPNERRVKYEVRRVGDELRVVTRRRPESEPTEMVAHPASAGEGALPARLALPELHDVPDNGLARTPPMGWNSWNKFAARVDDRAVRAMADAMASNGMKDAGYQYVNIDDTWQGGRDAQGTIVPNRKFPNMKGLADYVHSKGLKMGLYSSPGPKTCAGYEGSYGHEEQDARTYAAWGIDYLKYDWCGARSLYADEDMQAVYQKMGDALVKSGRPIFYSLCQYGRAEVWTWGTKVGGNAWRTTGDIRDTWDSMTKIGFAQDGLASFAKPGHWNDPDMLEIGNGGMTEDEYTVHMTLWALLAAPLLAGNDLREMTPAIASILINPEVIAVDQDEAGKQGRRISKSGDQEIWARPVSGNQLAVALFNRGTEAAQITVHWSDLGLKSTPSGVRDLWAHKDLNPLGRQYTASVPPHGAVLLRLGN